jgi:hypothetical protein
VNPVPPKIVITKASTPVGKASSLFSSIMRPPSLSGGFSHLALVLGFTTPTKALLLAQVKNTPSYATKNPVQNARKFSRFLRLT